MQKKSTGRRRFLHQVSAIAGLSSMLIFGRGMKQKRTHKSMFVHHVYFWLKNPDSPEDLAKLIEGLEKLRKVKTIRMSHIGKPAETNREVIDRSYSVSWLLFFDNLADEESYQKDPIHLDFVEKCSHLWRKVVVYDSVDA